MRMGDGKAGSGGSGSPHQLGAPKTPEARASVSVPGGGERKGGRTGAETVGDSPRGLGGRCSPQKGPRA